MMTVTRLKYIAKPLIVGGIVWFAGCNDFLSTLPDNRTALDTPEKITAILINAYPGGYHAAFTETMSDNVGDRGFHARLSGSGVEINEGAYQWEDITYEDQDAPVYYWNACYAAIAHANHALDAIEQLGGAASLNPQKGEALLARAYAHFMLVNLWAKHYDPATANEDLGIPYETASETVAIKQRKRNTVREVYDLIEKDITEGLPLLKSKYDNPKFHFTVDAAKAFATRFYLYKGEWEQVIKHASEILDDATVKIRDIVEFGALPSAQQGVEYAAATERANLLIASPPSFYRRPVYRARYGLLESDNEKIYLAAASNPFGKPWAYTGYSSGLNSAAGLYAKFNEYFVYTNVSAGTGVGYTAFVLLSYDEALLNRAEAYAMSNRFDEALADLAVFFSKKTAGFDPSTDVLTENALQSAFPLYQNYKPYYKLSPQQRVYINAITEARRREFMQEGHRWFDVKRFHIPVMHGNHTLDPDDPRRVLQIPSTAVKFGLKKNPRENG